MPILNDREAFCNEPPSLCVCGSLCNAAAVNKTPDAGNDMLAIASLSMRVSCKNIPTSVTRLKDTTVVFSIFSIIILFVYFSKCYAT